MAFMRCIYTKKKHQNLLAKPYIIISLSYYHAYVKQHFHLKKGIRITFFFLKKITGKGLLLQGVPLPITGLSPP